MRISLLFIGVFTIIMARLLRRDISNYNNARTSDGKLATPAWILIRGDVFRRPKSPDHLRLVVGAGIQIFSIVLFSTCK